MKISLTFTGLFLCLFATLCLAVERPNIEQLDFELGDAGGRPSGWVGVEFQTTHADSLIVHGGHWAGRIERDKASSGQHATLEYSVPKDFEGESITLHGWLKTENVTGFTGLWMRLDSDSGTQGFDNMYARNLRGTTDWTQYTVKLQLKPSVKTIVFGALLVGAGQVWVDDLELSVDGKPYRDLPVVEPPKTILDTDIAFTKGSNIRAIKLSRIQIDNLVLLGKVWGFLKYHHPAVVGGQRHWDFDLFRIMPDILAAGDRKAAVGELLVWLDDLGEVPVCDPCAALADDPEIVPHLEWLADENLLGRTLSRKLLEVHKNRPVVDEQFYVMLAPRVGNPVFQHELTYEALGFPDAGYRLLALFRHWNIIEYWFPNRDITDRDWHDVLAMYVPEVFSAADYESYYLAMLRLIAEVCDGHANLYSAHRFRPPVGPAHLPVAIRFIEDQPVVSAYVDSVRGPQSGLQVGDVIQAINGRSVSELIVEWEPFYPASNQAHRLRSMSFQLTRGAEGLCRVDVLREGRSLTLEPERMVFESYRSRVTHTHDLPGETFRLLGEDVAYLKLSSVETSQVENYVKQAVDTKGLIIDIRNYPKEFMVFALGERLVTKNTPFVRFTRGDIENPGAFLWDGLLELTPLKPTYEGRVVILVDEASMSQSEYTAMAFRSAPGAVVVGSTTAGADGNVSSIILPGGLRTMISGIGVYYPDRSPTQRVGIVPDVEALPTADGIRQGYDEVLEAGIRQILGADVSDQDIRSLYR